MNLRGVWGSAQTEVYAVGAAGTVVRYDGYKWHKFASSALGKDDLTGAWGFPNPSARWFVISSASGKIYKVDVSAKAVKQVYSTPMEMLGVFGASANNVRAVGAGGKMAYQSTPSWKTSIGVTPKDLQGVWLAPGGETVAVGDGATVVRYFHDGAKWKWDSRAAVHPSNCRLNAVWGSGPGDVYAVGDKGCVLRLDPKTNKWHQPNGSAHVGLEWNGIWGSGPSDIYVVGYNSSDALKGQILRFDGKSWKLYTHATGDPTVRLTAVWGDGKGRVFIVGDYQVIISN